MTLPIIPLRCFQLGKRKHFGKFEIKIMPQTRSLASLEHDRHVRPLSMTAGKYASVALSIQLLGLEIDQLVVSVPDNGEKAYAVLVLAELKLRL